MPRQSLEDLKPLLPELPLSENIEKEYSSNVGPRHRVLCRPTPMFALLIVLVVLNIALVFRQIYAGRQCTSDKALYSKWKGHWIIVQLV